MTYPEMCSSEIDPAWAIAEGCRWTMHSSLLYAQRFLPIENDSEIAAFKNLVEVERAGKPQEEGEVTVQYPGWDNSSWTYKIRAVTQSDIDSVAALKEKTPEYMRESLRLFAAAFNNASGAAEAARQNRYLVTMLLLESANNILDRAMGKIDRGPDPLSINARNAALVRLAGDPKQNEKTFVFDCWKEWQKDQSRYKGKAAFARDMLKKCQHLESQKVIEDWCRDWEKIGTQQAE